MSKERELLKQILEGDSNGDFFISFELKNKVIELLDHTEQDYLHSKPSPPLLTDDEIIETWRNAEIKDVLVSFAKLLEAKVRSRYENNK